MAVVARTLPKHASKRGWVLLGLAAASLGALAAAALFVWPDGPERTQFDLGRVDDYRIEQVTTVNEGRFHLVRIAPDEFIALAWSDPHSDCTVPWRPTFRFGGATGWFRDPCHGSTYTRHGARVFGPAPRDLDRYPVSVVGGRVTVRTDVYVCGHAPPGARCLETGPDEP
jgi:Rieske Fe-S protein